MAAPPPPAQPGEWMPSGFPPRSFPPGASAPLPPPPPPEGGRRGGRGWWLAAAAAFLAVLLLAAALLVATRGDDDEGPDLTAGTSTSELATTLTSIETTTTSAPLPSIEPVSTTAGAPPTTGAVAPGVLEASAASINLLKTDASAGASQAALALRNTGPTALTYTTQSSSAGLSAAPARGTIGPGGSAALTVTLDGARIQDEGPFSGTLTFGGTGGTKAVQVLSIVGRPPEIGDGVGESCTSPSAACSRQIKLGPSSSPTPSPCNTAWLYSVTIVDQSRIQSARAIARRGSANADTPLARAGNSDLYLSAPIAPLPTGTVLRFVIEAVDEHGFGRQLAQQTISC